MKRFISICTLLLCVAFAAEAATKSQVVVYVNGTKYYVHTIQTDETITSIAELYGISEQIIIDHNSPELKMGDNIKIPFNSATSSGEQSQQVSGIRRLMTFKRHTIEKGQTLYSISRQYEISIETIMDDNPELDPLHLVLGQTILIRKKMAGKSTEEQTLDEWYEYKENLSSATQPDGYVYHIVEAGETIYSLARQAQMGEEEFVALNNLVDGLKAGAMVKMPSDEGVMRSTDEGVVIEQLSFKKLRAGETLKVALMLPLSNEGRVQRQFADFYNGFIMGLESVKESRGCDIELNLYNTERSESMVRQIVESDEFQGTDLIVGPIYEELLEPIITYAERYHTPVVSPLATLSQTQSSVLFQLAPPSEYKYKKVEDMVADTKHITLIYTDKNDARFENSIKTLMGDRPYDTHIYEYEHPTIVAEKIKEEEESASDLSKFINNDKDNTIAIISDNETDVDRVLSALSSAQINIVARGGKSPKYRVLGNSDWSKYNNIDRTTFFKNKVVLLSSYQAKRDSDKIKSFDSNFIKSHGAIPTLYAYRGYDAAVIFGDALYSDIEYSLDGRLFEPLQSQYRFEIDPKSGIHRNVEWIRVNYNSNYTIKLE